MELIEKLKRIITSNFCDHKYMTSYLARQQEIIETQNYFQKYKNCHRDNEFVIIATGPTLAKFKKIDNAIYIGVNKAYKRKDLLFSYYFVQDYLAVKDYADELFKAIKCPKFIGKYIVEDDVYKTQFPIKYFQEENTIPYFTGWPVNDIFPDVCYSPFANCGTVAFAAIQFALLCGAKTVYLVGCDTSPNGYFDGSKQRNVKVTMNQEYLIANYKKLKKYVEYYYPESKIISVNPVGLKGIFEDIYQEVED